MPTTVEAQEKLPETRGRESTFDGTASHGNPAKSAAGAAVAEPLKPKAKKEKKEGTGNKRNKKAKKDAPKPLTKVGWPRKSFFIFTEMLIAEVLFPGYYPPTTSVDG